MSDLGWRIVRYASHRAVEVQLLVLRIVRLALAPRSLRLGHALHRLMWRVWR